MSSHLPFGRRPGRFELLEDRRLLAFTANLAAGVLTVDISGADEVSVSTNGSDLLVTGDAGTATFLGGAANVTDFDIAGDNGATAQIVRIDAPFVLSGNVGVSLVDTIYIDQDIAVSEATLQASDVEVGAEIMADGQLTILPSADGVSGLTVNTAFVNGLVGVGGIVIGDKHDTGGLTIGGAGIASDYDLTLQTAGTLTVDPTTPHPQLTAPTVTLNGNVSPGGSTVVPGSISVERQTLLTADNDFLVDIEGATAETEYDQLSVTGQLTIGDNVSLELSGGFVPAGNVQFVIVDTSSGVAGTFAGLPRPISTGSSSMPTRTMR